MLKKVVRYPNSRFPQDPGSQVPIAGFSRKMLVRRRKYERLRIACESLANALTKRMRCMRIVCDAYTLARMRFASESHSLANAMHASVRMRKRMRSRIAHMHAFAYARAYVRALALCASAHTLLALVR